MYKIVPDVRGLLAIPALYVLFQDIVGANACRKRFFDTYIASAMLADRPLRVLEVGCGPGTNLRYLPPGIDYVGCDISEDYIRKAQADFGDRGRFICLPVEELQLLDLGSFDVILLVGILHHIDDAVVRHLFTESVGLLREGGVFLVFEPCWTPRQSWLERWIMAKDRGKFIRDAEDYVGLLKGPLDTIELFELDVQDVRFPTSGCILRAVKPAAEAAGSSGMAARTGRN